MQARYTGLALAAGAVLMTGAAFANDDSGRDDDGPLTFAAIGDWPYSQNLLNNAHLLTSSVNADRQVSLVMHVGDLHSGSMPCTSAFTLPPIASANPGWNQAVFHEFQQFNAPVVYTPGDNEWADCHKGKQFSSGHPLRELASVRSLFFSRPGVSLGRNEMKVMSQAEYFDPADPSDSQFVENVMWRDGKVVFVTLNVPGGSNDDQSPWSGIFSNPAAQAQEVADRQGANQRWLRSAFELARSRHARAVVVGVQADMWDPEAIAAGGAGLDQYTPLVKLLADLSLQFSRPVLLINGDTHLFKADQPLADPGVGTGLIHKTPAVPNLTRLVVQGSTNSPAEWLRVTVDTHASPEFSWTNVPYCAVATSVICQ